jgi:hypothetical protein
MPGGGKPDKELGRLRIEFSDQRRNGCPWRWNDYRGVCSGEAELIAVAERGIKNLPPLVAGSVDGTCQPKVR